MASTTPEYFVPSTWDIPPNGPIALGSVITSLKKPQRRLTLCTPDEADVLPSSKFSVEVSKERLRSGGLSVLTTFLSGLLGLGVDVGADWEKSDKKAFRFDRMDTTLFVPTEDYVKRCVDDASVRLFLETSRYRKPVYIITGIKVVSGVQGATTSSRAVKGVVGAQVDGTVLSGGMVPIGGGPGIKRGQDTKNAVSWEGSTDFVFAFKVSEVRVRKSGEVRRERDYTKGALYEHRTEVDMADSLALSIAEVPALESQQGYKTEAVEENDVIVTYAIPVAEEE